LNAAMAEVLTGRKDVVDVGMTVCKGRNWLSNEPRRAGALKGATLTKRTREITRKEAKTSVRESARVDDIATTLGGSSNGFQDGRGLCLLMWRLEVTVCLIFCRYTERISIDSIATRVST
jgi:hypothetical protein